MLLQMVIGPLLMRKESTTPVVTIEKELLLLACNLGLQPISKGQTARYYEIKEGILEKLL